jgi:hypothetical protein
MEEVTKALHEFVGSKPGDRVEDYIEKQWEGEEPSKVPGADQLREAAVIFGAYCLLNLQGTALALGLNAAYSIAQFLNHLESKGKPDA